MRNEKLKIKNGQRTMKENIIITKSFNFAIRMVKLYQFLASEKKEFILSKQILRCGTSIGANIEEAEGGFSKKDFAAKMGIAYKEARETKYWLRLLKETEYIIADDFDSLLKDCEELLKILDHIIKTSKQ
jgi:four helix bundle protein